jgi:hypothetical protein
VPLLLLLEPVPLLLLLEPVPLLPLLEGVPLLELPPLLELVPLSSSPGGATGPPLLLLQATAVAAVSPLSATNENSPRELKTRFMLRFSRCKDLSTRGPTEGSPGAKCPTVGTAIQPQGQQVADAQGRMTRCAARFRLGLFSPFSRLGAQWARECPFHVSPTIAVREPFGSRSV